MTKDQKGYTNEYVFSFTNQGEFKARFKSTPVYDSGKFEVSNNFIFINDIESYKIISLSDSTMVISHEFREGEQFILGFEKSVDLSL